MLFRAILDMKKEYTRKIENKNINAIDISDSEYYTKIFYKAFPTLVGSNISYFQDYENIKPLDLNYILKHFALLKNIKFNNKYPNEDLLKNFEDKQRDFYLFNKFNKFHKDDTPFSVIFSLAENEYQSWLTMFYLLIKMPCFLAEFIIKVTTTLGSNINKEWIDKLRDYNNFLTNGIILPEERLTSWPTCYSTSARYEIIYSYILKFVIVMNYDFFKFYIETSAYSSIYQLFCFNDKKDEFIEKIITTSTPETNFNLLCFTFGELNKNQTNLMFKKLNQKDKYIKNGFVLMMANNLNKKYDCDELNKYLANRLLFELKE